MLHKKIIGVSGVAINDEGKYLITLRNDPRHPSMHHKWHVPGGGMEFGEQPEETLIRELKEELGVTATLLTHQPLARTYIIYKVVHILMLYFPITIGKQKILLDQSENIDYKWVGIDELDNFDFIQGNKEIIAAVHELHIHNKNSEG